MFIADMGEKKWHDGPRGSGEAPKLSARARFRRAGIIAKFSARAMSVAKEAAAVEAGAGPFLVMMSLHLPGDS
jgi:hypothetical protein